MARTGDALGYYYEEGFIQEDYHVYEPYIEEGYVEANYFQEQTLGEVQEASADLSVVFTQNTQNTRIKQFAVDLGALFSPNITARATRPGDVDLFVDTAFTATGSRIRENDVTLDNIVNLSLQAAITRNLTSNLSSTTTLAADAEIAILFDADLNSQFAQTASATKYILDPNYPNNRPKTITSVGNWTFDSVEQKHGSACIKTTDTTGQQYIQIDGDFQNVTNTSESFTLEFWYKVDTLINESADAIVFNYTSDTQTYQLQITLTSNGTADFEMRTPGTGVLADVTDVSFAQDVWHHIGYRVKPYVDISTPNVEVWIDNNRIYNFTEQNSEASADGPDDRLRLYAYDENGPTTYLDSLSIRRTANSGEYIPFQGKSGEPENDEDDTLVLALFNGDLRDSVTRTREFVSDLNSTATLTALGGAGFIGAAELATATTLTAGADKTSSTGATLASEFTQTATGEFVPLEFSAALNSAATITLSAGTIKTAQSEINTIFSQTTSSGAIRRAATSLNSVFAQNAVIKRFAGADTTLNAQADLNSQVTRIKQFAADLGALFTPNVTAIAQMTGEVLIQNEFTLAADNLRIRPGSADFAAINSQLAIAVVVASGSIELATNTSMVTLADKFSGSQANIASESELTATPTRIKQFASDQASVATINTQATVVTQVTLTAASEFTQTATAGAQRDFAVDFASIATTLTAGARIASFIVDPITQFEQSTTAQRLRAVESVQQVNAQLAAIIGELKSFDSAIITQSEIDTQASKITQTGAQLESRGLFGLVARATASGAVDLDAASELTATATVTRGATATQLSEFELLSAPDRKVSGGAALSLASELAATIGVIADFAATLNTQAEISVGGNLIIVDRVIFTIPREDTTYTIDRETRAHNMHQETRAYTIEGEQ